MKHTLKRFVLLLALALVAWIGSGCATTGEENLSAIPWNQPRGWENGLPGGILNQGFGR